MHSESAKRWGQGEDDLSVTDLLAKKDQQIRRLQAELKYQRERTEHALHMLELSKSVTHQSEEATQGLKAEVTRRIKAEQQLKRVKKHNEQLQNGLKNYIQLLQIQLQNKRSSLYSLPEPSQQ